MCVLVMEFCFITRLCEQLQTVSLLEHVVDCHKDYLNLDIKWNVGVLMERLIDRNISFLLKFNIWTYVCILLCSLRAIAINIHLGAI